MFEQRDVVLIPFPYSDLTISKRRPALIVSNEKMNKMQDRICCLVTTKFHKNDLAINKNSIKEGSLPFKSYIKPHRIFTINEGIIIKKLCAVDESLHRKVVKRIGEFLK